MAGCSLIDSDGRWNSPNQHVEHGIHHHSYGHLVKVIHVSSGFQPVGDPLCYYVPSSISKSVHCAVHSPLLIASQKYVDTSLFADLSAANRFDDSYGDVQTI